MPRITVPAARTDMALTRVLASTVRDDGLVPT